MQKLRNLREYCRNCDNYTTYRFSSITQTGNITIVTYKCEQCNLTIKRKLKRGKLEEI